MSCNPEERCNKVNFQSFFMKEVTEEAFQESIIKLIGCYYCGYETFPSSIEERDRYRIETKD